MSTILIEAYSGNGTRFYWEDNSEVNICKINESICISGNKSFFISLAKQMIYFASNDSILPYGTHIHYDQSFNHSHSGLELILEVISPTCEEISLDADDHLLVRVDLPNSVDRLHERWNGTSKIVVSATDSVHILADYHALMFMATALLFLVTTDTDARKYSCNKETLQGWPECAVIFDLIA